MSNAKVILNHIRTAGSLSIREAMNDYGMSGGSVTSTITRLRNEGHPIKTEMRVHPLTGRRYARYTFIQKVA